MQGYFEGGVQKVGSHPHNRTCTFAATQNRKKLLAMAEEICFGVEASPKI